MEEEDRGRVWRLYGWYSGLMACGSFVGAVAWAAQMRRYASNARAAAAKSNLIEHLSLVADGHSWFSAFRVTYSIEFMCLTSAKLMVLDRMSVFATHEDTGMRRRWVAAGRIVMAVVTLGNAVGLAANMASAVHYQNAAVAENTASAYHAANKTKDAEEFSSSSRQEVQLGGFISSVQRLCEVAVLLLIVVAFVTVGLLSMHRVRDRLLGVDTSSAAAATGRVLRRQIMGTTAFVFVTFLIRSVLSIMFAVAYELRDFAKICHEGVIDICDASCYNVYAHFVGWTLYTPEFESTIVLVSSPVALLVALWGMTSKVTLQLMKSSGRESAMSLKLIKSNKREKAAIP